MNTEIGSTKGGFTLPGEAGYEELTLKLAKQWGADVIRDSDGTELSREILDAGYGIYSTICIIRDHNDWAKENMDKLQQTFLVTQPKVAVEETVSFRLMEDFFEGQFQVNDREDAMKYWQVYDRTNNAEVPREKWNYNRDEKTVEVIGVTAWHRYTVSFLAYRIWEEISMYNHTTNGWDKEHLMQIDPRYPETQEYMLGWIKEWCETHPDTTVVRFTSMFYNFAWMWGSSERNRHLFTDWASYDFTVSPLALDEFAKKYGYAMTAEDFVNQGKFHVTHMPGNKKKADWMEFINNFVIQFGKKLVKIVHDYGKEAYVFYDDSWVGNEPYGKNFEKFGFDGIIKAVFSGFESRLCSGVRVKTHELRLHPYLFPTGVDGSPSFLADGDPRAEAQRYWKDVRRAVLRQPVDRIGLGGYLHLVERKPEFVSYIEELAEDFRKIRELHKTGAPRNFKPRVAVLHYWGSLRSWTLSGHFHETYMHDLIHINESLSGLPFEVSFINFEDIKKGVLDQIDVLINAGAAKTAWSGGDVWKDDEIVERLTKWVYGGGAFIGVNEPSAADGYDTYFRMAHVLGVDKDTGARVCHGKWSYTPEEIPGLIPEGAAIKEGEGLYLTDGTARVLLEKEGQPLLTVHSFGRGCGIYLSSYRIGLANTRMLQNLILFGAGEKTKQDLVTSNVNIECAYFPEGHALVVINNTDKVQETEVTVKGKEISCRLKAYQTEVINIPG
ncbi:1,3-beta-galactosyl-N-acetylhexosamine phosphorylase [uncultured Robinsoniella sp.]|uniref:1,3-beta-galactosyl-N-acetylhexosamine phosphorylase n=1 Tax=uncultured Robinsoniella sp. TaxID=904190 RepID=UPI00374E597E